MHPILEQLERDLSPALEGLDAAQTQLRPTAHPDKWSIQQIVDHLILTYGLTQHALATRIAKGRPTEARASITQRARQLVLVTAGFFPKGRPAPPAVLPMSTEPLTGQALIQAVHLNLTGVDLLSNQAEAIFEAAAPSVTRFSARSRFINGAGSTSSTPAITSNRYSSSGVTTAFDRSQGYHSSSSSSSSCLACERSAPGRSWSISSSTRRYRFIYRNGSSAAAISRR